MEGKNIPDSPADRNSQLSYMRVAGCVAIIVLHSVFAANEYYLKSITPAQNVVSRIVENNMMWAVPVFLMVTGALHLNPDKQLTLRKLYGKYIWRVFCALVLFSFVFRIFDMVMDKEGFSAGGLLMALSELLKSKGWGHLWYLYLLIGLYVLMPFYRKIVEFCTDRELMYLAAVYVVFVSFIPMLEGAGIKIGFYISESIIYPLYLLLGYMLHAGRWKVPRGAAAVLLLLSTVGITILSVCRYGAALPIPSVLVGYASPLVIMQAVGVFSVMEELRSAGPRAGRCLASIDQCSFGIYLIHMMFVRLLFRYMQFNPYVSAAPLTIFACITGIFLVSYVVVLGLRKVPGLKKIL